MHEHVTNNQMKKKKKKKKKIRKLYEDYDTNDFGIDEYNARSEDLNNATAGWSEDMNGTAEIHLGCCVDALL
ncbi:hypothetical protein CYMTET_7959 [Cymbomonas tetramitiformis]|uniref:Uncharacterized protein n=1 Tax=Cymbomonas tetramitiformis TaxID=36881 RepID=A0AAE0LGG7_9CHLO|nr:hypothetical protein CYMTET_7959 [Cymbomonas tetramitiformis]